jgi:aryl-alcohol dehydrogenase-like predicted oxidoreductase
MEQRQFGRLGQISALTLGGGGIGGVWGTTSRDESVATVREAADAGITFFDMAPSYGRGVAEEVLGAAFNGRLPEGARVSTKCLLGNPEPGEVEALLERSLHESMARMRVQQVSLFLLHGQIVPDGEAHGRGATPYTLFSEVVRPFYEKLLADGRIGAWGITGVGRPAEILRVVGEDPAPGAIQCVANLLDSPGGMKSYSEAARPRAIIAAAAAREIGVMGIRAVQAGALTDAPDRELLDGSAELADYQRAAPFRALAQELGESAAALAHRYALSLPGISTVILGVKNRAELHECVEAAARGPLSPDLIARIDASVQG